MNGGQAPEPPDDVRDQGTLHQRAELPPSRVGIQNNTEGGVSPAGGGRDGEERREEGIRRAEGAERMQMQRIRELDLEQLEVEEVDSDAENLQSDDDSSEDGGRGDGGAGARGGFTFDTTLTSQHTYLGEVDDISQARSFLSGGDILTLPMFYLEGIVLFPDDTLPLRVLQPRFKAAVERAMRQTEAPCTLGVIHLRARMRGSGVPMLSVGTTAEIRQLSRLSDGSMNVVTRGRQRFRIRKAWTEPDGAPCAQVQIIEEDTPLHIPRDAFGAMAAVPSLQSGRVPRCAGKDAQDGSDEDGLHHISSEGDYFDDDSDSGEEDRGFPFGLFGGDHVQWQREENHRGGGEDESSEEEERLRWWWRRRRDGRNRRRREPRTRRENRTPPSGAQGRVQSSPEPMDQGETSAGNAAGPSSKKLKLDSAWGGACKAWAGDERKWLYRAQRTAWPHWVYRMYDAYDLARRAADMLRQFVDLPKMDELIRDPAALSFFIARNTPLQDSTRQELLEVDGVVHRLRREIQLLESLDRLRCKICMAVIARRSDVILMSTEGAISTLVNPGGYVHETLTLSRAWGLMLRGRPDTAHSWFPGYAWTIAHCSQCELHMGWRFTAVKKGLRPKAFWGVRRSQLAENAVR